jgi:hypothetical protein
MGVAQWVKSPLRLDLFGVSGERVKNSTLRILGVIAAVVLVVTVGAIAAQAVQSPTQSQIPTVVTGRPLGSEVTTPTGVAPTESTIPTPATNPVARDHDEESHEGLNPEIVTPSVRDNDKHHHDDKD